MFLQGVERQTVLQVFMVKLLAFPCKCGAVPVRATADDLVEI